MWTIYDLASGVSTKLTDNLSSEIYFMHTQELEGVQFGCGIKPIEVPAVVTYTVKADSKAKTVGEIVSLDFVPKSFTLN